jgi:hypothetical protein
VCSLRLSGGDACVLDNGLGADDVPTSEQDIAMDSAARVLCLVAKRALQRSCCACLSPCGMICMFALRCAI